MQFGCFCVKKSSLFKHPKIIYWQQYASIIFTIICKDQENAVNATSFLKMFAQILRDHFKAASPAILGKEFLLKPDEVNILLSQFLPGGKLIFLSGDLTKFLRKQAEAILLGK
eukprot:TRINITY_DN26259_c0_g1_i1.p1 TRINITY_DN26259_c0_g1~~TRINITY_DN26259_c0_g1_i1.p1  ORF type:complete len:131 (+),score=9.72 TRINITY_DN26259_c0_g1_i1:56-394(+)